MQNGYRIEARKFSYTYPETAGWVLENMDFAICAGEKILVTGASGSGKTTLLYAMQGIVPGVLGGKVQGSMRCGAGRSGLALQNPDAALFAPTVRDELSFALQSKSNGAGAAGVDEVLDAFGIAHFAKRRTPSLSMGEKQRVVLASIFITRPKVLLLDEPASCLDAQAKAAFRAALQNYLDGDGILVVAGTGMSTPDLPFDKVVKLSNGNGISVNAADFDLPSPGESIFEASGISVGNGSGDILHDVDTYLRRGEIVKLVGANGSGKSTLIKALAGLWKLSQGKITREKGVSVGYLPQNPEQLLFCRTVAEEIGFACKNGKSERIADLAEMLNLTNLLDHSPHKLSLGQKQRVAIAAILAPQPDVILLDEPAAHLDKRATVEMWKALYAEARRGAAVLIAEHEDSQDVPCTRKIVIDKGVVIKEGA